MALAGSKGLESLIKPGTVLSPVQKATLDLMKAYEQERAGKR